MTSHDGSPGAAPRNRLRLDVRPWSLLLLVSLTLVLGWHVIQLEAVFESRPAAAQATRATLVVVLLLGLILAHEAGHVLAGRILGYRWTLLRLAVVPGVGLEPVEGRSNRDQLVISAGGPLVGVAAAAAVGGITLWTGGHWYSPWIVIATTALVMNVVQLVPLAGSDGQKIAVAAHHAARGRGGEPFPAQP